MHLVSTSLSESGDASLFNSTCCTNSGPTSGDPAAFLHRCWDQTTTTTTDYPRVCLFKMLFGPGGEIFDILLSTSTYVRKFQLVNSMEMALYDIPMRWFDMICALLSKTIKMGISSSLFPKAQLKRHWYIGGREVFQVRNSTNLFY